MFVNWSMYAHPAEETDGKAMLPMTTQDSLPLDGIRVLDLSGPVGAYGGRLLADIGADVVKVELPAGDELRSQAPFAGRRSDPERSLTFAYYHAATSAGSSLTTAALTRSACWPSWAAARTSCS